MGGSSIADSDHGGGDTAPPAPPLPPALGADTLDAVVAALEPAACRHFRQVSREWRDAFQSCHAPLPPLKLAPPLDSNWLSAHARRLRALQLSGVDELPTAGVLAELRALTSLSLDSCRRLTALAPLAELGGSLRRISLRGCRALVDLSPLGGSSLPLLETLLIDRCGAARDLTPLSGHPRLAALYLGYDVYSAVSLQLPSSSPAPPPSSAASAAPAASTSASAAASSPLPALRRLRVMAAIQDLTPCGAYVGLASLEVFAVGVCSLTPLATLTSLRELDLHQLQDDLLAGADDHHAMSPRNPFLPLANSLQSLGLTGADDAVIGEVVPWHALGSTLTRVDLHGSGVRDASLLALCNGLSNSLVSLDLAQTRHVRDLSPLWRCTRLAEVNLIGSTAALHADVSGLPVVVAGGGGGGVSSAAS